MASYLRQLGPVRLAGGVVVYGLGVFVSLELSRPKPKCPSCEARRGTFSALAPNYDAEIARDESSSGILELRKELATHARGRGAQTLSFNITTPGMLHYRIPFTDLVFDRLSCGRSVGGRRRHRPQSGLL